MSKPKPRLWNPKGHRAVDWKQSAIEKRLKQGPLYACIKEDGFRCHIGYIGGRLVCTTREGIEMVSLRLFYAELASLWDAEEAGAWALSGGQVLDAEVVIRGLSFEEMSGHLRCESPIPKELRSRVQFVVFDVESSGVLTGEAPRHKSLDDRRHRLQHILSCRASANGELRRVYLENPDVVTSIADIHAAYFRARLHGHEGLVLKDPKSPYKNGKVTGWWKVKPGCGAEFAPGFDADGTVVDVVMGDEDKGNSGKVVGFRVHLEDGTVVNCTGLTQAAMEAATKEWREDNAAFFGRQCRVSAMEKTASGSLRHPHFDGFRDIGGSKA